MLIGGMRTLFRYTCEEEDIQRNTLGSSASLFVLSGSTMEGKGSRMRFALLLFAAELAIAISRSTT